MKLLSVTILGMGYVGLPLAINSSKAGYKTFGVDIDEHKLELLKKGKSIIEDIDDKDIDDFLIKNNSFSNKIDGKGSDVYVICVPTPLMKSGKPDLSYVKNACTMIKQNLKINRKALIILESTTYPGTTEEIVKPILESGGFKLNKNFFLGFSPERIDPGQREFSFENIPKVVSGINPESLELVKKFYSKIFSNLIQANGVKEAEMSKLLENTFRHVNIALVNEMVQFCKSLKIDFWEVIRLADSKPYGFMKFVPSAGVGGHCIPIDPNYLSYDVKKRLGKSFKFVELAEEINKEMPKYVVTRASNILKESGVKLHVAKILILGVSYKRNIADTRESPGIKIIKDLISSVRSLSYCDPLVNVVKVHKKVLKSVALPNIYDENPDLVLIIQNHDQYNEIDFSKFRKVFDTTGDYSGANIERM
jgi:UDP-N-acetyl-D-glucosamine dehydrogenase